MMMAATDDDIPEEKEFFRLNVSSSDSMVDVDERSSVRIYINDNGINLNLIILRFIYSTCSNSNNGDTIGKDYIYSGSHLMSYQKILSPLYYINSTLHDQIEYCACCH